MGSLEAIGLPNVLSESSQILADLAVFFFHMAMLYQVLILLYSVMNSILEITGIFVTLFSHVLRLIMLSWHGVLAFHHFVRVSLHLQIFTNLAKFAHFLM